VMEAVDPEKGDGQMREDVTRTPQQAPVCAISQSLRVKSNEHGRRH
jgi:hypothetical protein